MENRQRAGFFPNVPKDGHDPVQGIVPGHGFELSAGISAEGGREAATVVDPLHVGQALQADFAGGGGVLGVPFDLHQTSVLHRRQHPARAIAVSGTNGTDDPTTHGRAPLARTPMEASKRGKRLLDILNGEGRVRE